MALENDSQRGIGAGATRQFEKRSASLVCSAAPRWEAFRDGLGEVNVCDH